MLKNKKTVYLLIPINILIWGFFVYRFYSAYHETDDLSSSITSAVVIPKEINGDTAVYQLDLHYKDPFLKDEPAVRQQSSRNALLASEQKTSPPVSAPKTPTPSAKPMPEIKYLGMIRNKTSGVSTALISLNGESHQVKPSQVIDGITVKSFCADSLVARWGKEKIVLRR